MDETAGSRAGLMRVQPENREFQEKRASLGIQCTYVSPPPLPAAELRNLVALFRVISLYAVTRVIYLSGSVYAYDR